MDQNLHVLFERALDDEPVPPPGDLAAAAMADGSRRRRRRRLLAVGSVTAMIASLVTIVGLSLTSPAEQSVQVAGAKTACVAMSHQPVTSVAVYLVPEITDQQRLDLQGWLGKDPRVREVRYESREQAFQKFEALWHDSPEFAKSVGPRSLPASFQVELVKAAQYRGFVAGLKGVAGIQDVVGQPCPASSTPREGK